MGHERTLKKKRKGKQKKKTRTRQEMRGQDRREQGNT